MRMALVLGLLCLTACNSNSKSSSAEYEAQVDAKIKQQDAAKSYKSKHDDHAPVTLDSDGLPAFAPKYPGSTITSNNMSRDAKGFTSVMVTFTTPDSMDAVTKFYEDHFAKFKMDMPGNFTTEDTSMVIAQAKNKKATVMLSAKEGGITEGILTFSDILSDAERAKIFPPLPEIPPVPETLETAQPTETAKAPKAPPIPPVPPKTSEAKSDTP